MMFCKNCGAEIKNNGKFCGQCGTPVGEVKQTIVSSENFKASILSNTPIDGSLAVKFIIAAVLQLIMLLLRFLPFGKYRVAIEELGISNGGTYSINKLMGSSGETAIFVILILFSITLCILPIIKNNLGNRRRMIISKIVAFWNTITVGIGIWALADSVAKNKESFVYNFGEKFFTCSWSLTFGGWLNIIITLATIVLLFVISKKTKQYIKK